MSMHYLFLALSSVLVVSFFLVLSHNAYAMSYTLSDNLSCTYATQNGGLGGTWDSTSNSCTINYLTLNAGDSLTVQSPLTLVVDHSISNGGTITNSGILTINHGAIIYNTIGNFIINSGTINNNGTINNSGTVNNKLNGIINNNVGISGTGSYITNSGTITNYGSISSKIDNNAGTINNSGTISGSINQFCGGSISGNAVTSKTLQCTSITINSSKNPSLFNQQITFTVTVMPAGATGNFTFYDGTNKLYAGTLVLGGTGSFSTSTLTAGTHSIYAVYSGDANDGFSTSPILTQTVKKGSTTVTVTSSQNPSTVGQSVTFTATISPSTATGTVQFTINGNPAGSPVQVTGGQATYSISSLPIGSYQIAASYSGDTSDLGGTSSVVTQTINPPPDTIPPVVTPSPNQVVTATSSNYTVVNYPKANATDNVGVTSGPTCNPPSGSTFSVGTTIVTCTASDAAGNIGTATFTVTVQIPPKANATSTNVSTATPTGTIRIPQWIHNNAKWWSDGTVSNHDFIQGIQYMIQQKIIIIPKTAQSASVPTDQIPAWIKDVAGYWANGKISDDEFVKGIQFLVQVGIIKV